MKNSKKPKATLEQKLIIENLEERINSTVENVIENDEDINYEMDSAFKDFIKATPNSTERADAVISILLLLFAEKTRRVFNACADKRDKTNKLVKKLTIQRDTYKDLLITINQSNSLLK